MIKKKNIIGLITLLLGILLVCLLTRNDKVLSVNLNQNAEVLLDGEATMLFDCYVQSSLYNSGFYACVCYWLTTDYVVYPCSFIHSATSETKKCTAN